MFTCIANIAQRHVFQGGETAYSLTCVRQRVRNAVMPFVVRTRSNA